MKTVAPNSTTGIAEPMSAAQMLAADSVAAITAMPAPCGVGVRVRRPRVRPRERIALQKGTQQHDERGADQRSRQQDEREPRRMRIRGVHEESTGVVLTCSKANIRADGSRKKEKAIGLVYTMRSRLARGGSSHIPQAFPIANELTVQEPIHQIAIGAE